MAQTLDDLLKMPAESLAYVDIAEMNLLCAEGLPGAENLDINHALATLDAWAARVAYETNRHLYRVTDPRYADHYRHSEACLRAEMLLQALQEDLGVKYDMTAAHNFTFNDSRVAFIHGMIPMPGQTLADTPGGTCASMPVMYVAVGRRLGYPLRLVTTKGHVFVRWEGRDHANPAWRERFNIEGSGEGFNSYDDEHYKTWPFKISDAEVKAGRYLVSLSPAEELASFLASRGHCLLDNGRTREAVDAYAAAHRLVPQDPAYLAWMQQGKGRLGPSRPVAGPRDSREPPMVYRNDPLADLEWVNALNRANMQRSQPPMPGVPPIPMPPPPQSGLPQPYQPPAPGRPPRS